MTPKLRTALAAFLVALPLDQVTKLAVDRHLTFADRIQVIEGFFYLTHVRNTGAAFGLFADSDPTLRMLFFVGVALIALFIIGSFFSKLAPGDRLPSFALGLILAGAIGNLIDRVSRGEVIDFLHFKLWAGYSWPDFNVADSCIVIGVGLLMLELIASEGESRAGVPSDEPSQSL
jgi:signal peptidase II